MTSEQQDQSRWGLSGYWMYVKGRRVGAFSYKNEPFKGLEGSVRLIFVQSGPPHPALGFGGFHERVPDKASP